VPERKKPDLLHAMNQRRKPRTDSRAGSAYRPSAPLRTPATKAFHWTGVNLRTAPCGFLLSLT
jgi:hypothetical protein